MRPTENSHLFLKEHTCQEVTIMDNYSSLIIQVSECL